ncbi:hypothetical protein SARC_10346 [Sphaeroforma arctica JP610]|uniref:DNA2/NAM7 helicase-like C-terminal domain-containing protein n=1 Tax=Sphaeroforma arctica JP610 TaxID=667725 RepID=A0A0L0FMC9_9EUKA|nr:hypothetical protein SARC_10346 [Sphaeroforma arctica JP610]KNC77188.1 hypothetical protein SARC_10346 [Sphaeroforma arctica JP610]|eukprot:XP_014151090.1 hypothetical protein SARC_10346 [Sphaeroforma arctica JP610]
MAFQKFSNMEQSMFTRFIRLNVPAVHLDAQGRARSSIAQLYSWRYKKLDNLPHVQALPEFTYGNAGFKYDYQFIDVGPFNEQGETEPTPHFIQNLGEAEYVVATYMFMRLLGYAAEKISVITTYNGQAALLRDVFTARCGQSGSLYGMPAAIATVDKFQGQQNDYVLLSLVRTKTIGHIRDVRRLVVALSRARLGLYVFGRLSMFKDCFELQNAMDLLVKRPTTLQLVLGETYPCGRKNTNHAKKNVKGIEDVVAMHEYVAGVASQMNRQLDAYSQQASKAEQALPEDKQPQDPADPATVTDDTATQAESVESSRMEGTNTESDVANGVAEGGESVSGGAMDVDGPTDEIPTSEAMETDGVKPEGTVTGAVAESVADGEVVDKTAANDV